MPIRPENLHRYPVDWPEIRKRILKRACYCCEHPGCTAKHHELGYWLDNRWVRVPSELIKAGVVDKPGVITTPIGPIKIIRIVLTVAHLDHQPENCADNNLRAWCQRHHLSYDAKHHSITRARTRNANANTVEMF